MKIIIINGSPRNNGSTAFILKTLERELKKKDNTKVSFYNIFDMNLQYCIGCSYCYESGECFMDDDLEKLSKEIATADGIIIGSPTYYSNVPSQVKTLIDRGHFVIEQGLHGKYAMGVVTFENYEGSKSSATLKKLFSYSGAFISSMIQMKLPFTHSPSLGEEDERKIKEKADKFYNDIKNKRQYPIQKIKHDVVFNMGIKPFVLKKGKYYQGVVDSWKERSII